MNEDISAQASNPADRQMNRSELIAELADQLPMLHRDEVDAALRIILDCLSDALAAGERIEIRGFGCFSLRRHTRPRRGGTRRRARL
jgi:integration host factor subunit beta